MTAQNLNEMRNCLNAVNNLRQYVPNGFTAHIDIPIINKTGKLVGRIKAIPGQGAVYVPAQSGYETYEPPTEKKDDK